MNRLMGKLKQRALGAPFRPDPRKHSFLASFPRSGNTWIRAVLFHYIYDRPPNDFDELHLGVPDEHISVPARRVYVGRSAYPQANVIKTHHPYQLMRSYQKVAYIVRDPRDALPSYWKFLSRQKSGFDHSFEDFIFSSMNGAVWPCSWYEHVLSWSKVGRSQVPNIQVIRFEDLKNGNAGASELLCNGLGLPDTDRLHNIIAEYDLERMRLLEAAGLKKKGEESRTKPGFIGSGVASEEMREIAGEAIRKNAAGWRALMKEFDYHVA